MSTDVKPTAYVTFDLETTGLSILRHGICQIGAYATGVSESEMLGHFVMDTDPRRDVGTEISEEAFAVNGFTLCRLDDAQTLGVVLRRFLDFLDNLRTTHNVILVAHNLKFDAPFIEVACERFGIEFPYLRRALCTVSLAHAILGGELYSLKNLSQALGISNSNAHDALSDAICTSKVLHALLRKRDESKGQQISIQPAPLIHWWNPGINAAPPGNLQPPFIPYAHTTFAGDVVLGSTTDGKNMKAVC